MLRLRLNSRDQVSKWMRVERYAGRKRKRTINETWTSHKEFDGDSTRIKGVTSPHTDSGDLRGGRYVDGKRG